MKIKFKQPHELHQTHASYLSWAGILLIIIGGYIYPDGFIDQSAILVLCSFLILTIGISHGALDHEKGKKILKIYKIKKISIFYLIYLTLGILVSFLWFFFPELILIIFLTIASYHFGKEDCSIYPTIKNSLMFGIKGSLVIWAPLFFHFDNTLSIFEILYFERESPILINILIYLHESNFILFFLILSVLINLFIFKITYVWIQFFTESFIILVINFLYSPVLAFTFYFCFLHSIRHTISLIIEMKIDFKIFYKKALPLTLATIIIFVGCGWVITLNNYTFDNVVVKVIFVGLASLTFPHILLEYLLVKNRK